MSKAAAPVSGASIAILVGGDSRRMGTNKALLPLPPTGETILARQCRLLRPLADDLMIIGPPLPAYEALQARLVRDEQPGAGPLGGLATALTAARHERCLVLACDLPLLAPALAAHLLQQPLTTADAAVPTVVSDGQDRRQPLFAVYHARSLPIAHVCLQRGERRMQAFLDAIRVFTVAEATLRVFDSDLVSFHNTNDPAALASVLAILAARWEPDPTGHPT